MTFLATVKEWARGIKRDVTTLWLAARSDHVPWLAKAVAAATVAYALSPIDLIPDFVPVLGYLDDLIIVPLGIAIAIRLIPPDILADLRLKAQSSDRPPASRAGMAAIVVIWLIASGGLILWYFGAVKS